MKIIFLDFDGVLNTQMGLTRGAEIEQWLWTNRNRCQTSNRDLK